MLWRFQLPAALQSSNSLGPWNEPKIRFVPSAFSLVQVPGATPSHNTSRAKTPALLRVFLVRPSAASVRGDGVLVISFAQGSGRTADPSGFTR
jgi:hypothetical protein